MRHTLGASRPQSDTDLRPWPTTRIWSFLARITDELVHEPLSLWQPYHFPIVLELTPVETHIALFRGINVGGRNLLPMRELVERLQTIGLRDVSTYIQSGNVVFRSREDDTVDLADRIGSVIHKSHGFTPEVMILTLDQLEDALASNPYPQAEHEPKSLHLFFLATIPDDTNLEFLESIKRDSEDFELRGRVFYLHAPDGIGRSKLAAGVERTLGVPVTARNWRSAQKILDMARALP